MEYALIDGVRSLPSPGAQGACQGCGAPMTAKCGELIVWHWAHRGRRVCDPWWEREGEWHRKWKDNFPSNCREVVQFDISGEKHIADVKLPSGLVVELQHSAMSLDEMRSREAFYGDMIWIVDAVPFLNNLTMFDPLPAPTEPFVSDLLFVQPLPSWRRQFTRTSGFEGLMFSRRSERLDRSASYVMHFGREIAEHFPTTYCGHHLFLWMKPRDVWFHTTKPTYLDLGGGTLALLCQYGPWPDTFKCLQLVAKQDLVGRLLS